MSLNKAINATIALVEGRTDIAKEVFRAPDSDVKDIPAVVARLEEVVNKAAAKAIRNGLVRALSIQPNVPISALKELRDAYEEGFYAGMNQVETLFETIAEELGAQ
jgi:hypothetical protein